MNLILAEIQASQWVLLGVILLVIVCYPVLMIFRNKREQKKVTELNQSIKLGKDVLTSSGVYGTIVDIRDGENGSKIVTLQTGVDDKKSYLSVDSLAIYMVLNPDPVEPAQPQPAKAKSDEKSANPQVEPKATEVKTDEAEVEPEAKAEEASVVEEKSKDVESKDVQQPKAKAAKSKSTKKSDKKSK